MNRWRPSWAGAVLLLAVVAVALLTSWSTGELGTVVVLGAAAAVLGTGLVRLGLRAWCPVGWRAQAWTVGACAFLLLFGQLAPLAGATALGLYVIVFVFVGVTASPRTGLLLLPLPVVGVLVALDMPPSQLAVRGGLAIGIIVVVSQLPSRLLASLAERQASVEREHERTLAAERELAAGMQGIANLFDASPVAMSVYDADGRLVRINDAACSLVGRRREDVVGLARHPWIHPDETGLYVDMAARLKADPHGVEEVEARFVRPDGSIRWVWLTCTQVAGGGKQHWTLVHGVDTTDRRLAEDAAQRSAAVSEALADLARAAHDGQDPRSRALSVVREVTSAEVVALLEPGDDTGDELVVTTALGARTCPVRFDLRAATPLARVWRRGEATDLVDVSTTREVTRGITGAPLSSVVLHPVLVDGEVRAVVLAGWHESRTELAATAMQEVARVCAEVGSVMEAYGRRVELEGRSTTDPLTGLANRRGWDQQLGPLVAAAHRRQEPAVLVMLDVDRFKRFNDTFGHGAGDELLVELAATLRANVRQEDLVSRWGGDEFAIAMSGCSVEEASLVFDRFRGQVPREQRCSIGVAECVPGESVGAAMERADRALYEAKGSGRDAVRCA